MKLKYYLRGMGIGIILTALVMGFALGGRKATMSDADVIKRAKELGMVEADAGVLTQTQTGQDNEKKDTSSSDTPLGKTGEKIPEEDNKELPGADKSDSEVAGEQKETETPQTEEGSDDGESQDDAVGKAEEGETNVADTASAADTEETVSDPEPEHITEIAQAVGPAPDTGNESASGSGKTVTIPGGLGSEGVSAILAREGLVDDATSFNRYLVDNRIDRIVRSGVKTIPEGASYEEIAAIITK